MRRLRKSRNENFTVFIGLAIVIIISYIFLHFTNNKKYIAPVYDVLLKEKHYYNRSKIDGWHKINCGPFQIETPNNYFFYRKEGIDSYVGGFTNNKDSCEFDYGLYSDSFERYSLDTFKTNYLKIGSKKFKLVYDKNTLIGAFTKDLDNEKRLTFYFNTNMVQNLDILKTLKFK